MTATTSELAELHKLVATSLKQRIQEDLEQGIPTDAAIYGVAIKLLKDNNITANPIDSDELHELREKIRERAEKRGQKLVQLLEKRQKTAVI